ncbi:hypothetical protein [Salipiger thiooxidans]|uniref:hypothetical protein n=1 Tax=Salipiger thiooxidans TaxID=282683 RepID=UPI001F60EAF1|nr:hypothetical protein [Salipiger thiooxidans]
MFQHIDAMKLRVRPARARAEAQERAGLEPVLGADALAGDEPPGADLEGVRKRRMAPERQRLGHAVLDLHLEVVSCEVLAHAGQVRAQPDAERAQQRGGAMPACRWHRR